MEAIELLREWPLRVYRMQMAHYDAAIHFERLHLLLGIPVIVLSTVVGTAIFASLQTLNSLSILRRHVECSCGCACQSANVSTAF